MHRNALIKVIVTTTILVFSFMLAAQAQERSIRPAFPLAAGQEMIVFPGALFYNTAVWSNLRYYEFGSSAETIRIILTLPVGERIHRLLGNFVDATTAAGADITVSLVRIKDDDSIITLRSFTTSGIHSSTFFDFKQVVSNPLDHAVLQNSVYFVKVSVTGAQALGELKIGEIKIIYEP